MEKHELFILLKKKRKTLDTVTKSEIMSELARLRSQKLTKQQRSDIARKAANARWGNM